MLPSFPLWVQNRVRITASLFVTALLAGLFAFSGIPRSAAQSQDPPDTENTPDIQSGNPSSKTESKQIAKYDVARIGARDISRGFNLYSLKREHELGEGIAATFNRNAKLINDPVVNEYVDRIAQKLVRCSDANIPFTVRVIDSSDIPSAYGLPGGFLYVSSALVMNSDGEAELAGIMAHEIAHVAARHATRALSRRRVYTIASTMSMVGGPAGAGISNVAGIAGPLSGKKFSRDAEYEADLLGLEYTYAAGYDPQALLDALEKLHALDKSSPFSKIPAAHLASRLPFHRAIAKSMANYPMIDERIRRLQAEIPLFLPKKDDYIIDTNEFEEVKARLEAANAPVLHNRHAGDDDSKGPVLRRNTQEWTEVNPRAGSPAPSMLSLLPHR